MSGYPPPPPYYGPPPPGAPWHPPQHHTYPPSDQPPQHYPYPYYMPGTMMIPVPVAQMPMPHPQPQQPPPTEPTPTPTYITNYIYNQGEPSNQVQIADPVSVPAIAGELEWVASTATTAHTLSGRALVGGYEGWDGSPLWVIRAWHSGDLIPGKLSVRHSAASVMYDGKEIPVQNIEVLCARPEHYRWLPSSNGSVPAGAVAGGRTATGETLYVGRARYQLSVTPGKVHPSHNACYIGFAGAEVAHKMYDVLCKVS